jgi:cell division protease FtsH
MKLNLLVMVLFLFNFNEVLSFANFKFFNCCKTKLYLFAKNDETNVKNALNLKISKFIHRYNKFKYLPHPNATNIELEIQENTDKALKNQYKELYLQIKSCKNKRMANEMLRELQKPMNNNHGYTSIVSVSSFSNENKTAPNDEVITPPKRKYGISKSGQYWKISKEKNELQLTAEMIYLMGLVQNQTFANNNDGNVSSTPPIEIEFYFPDEIVKHTQNYRQNRKNAYRDASLQQKKTKKTEHFETIDVKNYNFSKVAGYDEVKEQLMQSVDIMRNANYYKNFNVRVPKSILLYGQPGTGKTLLAKSFAGELNENCSFIHICGSDFTMKYVGEGIEKLNELFTFARENTPIVIFIDEIESLARKRGGDDQASKTERDTTLNKLLFELDGTTKSNDGLFFIFATNKIELLDNAFLRPGRVDKKIYVGLPDETTRKGILDIHLQGKPHTDDIKKDDLIEITDGFSGAEIENVLNEAMLYALRQNKTKFNMTDFNEMTELIIGGTSTNLKKMDGAFVKRIAIHEMGHVYMGLSCLFYEKINRVVLQPKSPKMPGYTVFQNANVGLHTKEYLFEHLMIIFAGRIAEEMIYGTSITSGASNDLQQATKLAKEMIMELGMGNRLIFSGYGDSQKNELDAEIDYLLRSAYRHATKIMKNAKPFLLEGATLLIEKKNIRLQELQKLYDKLKYSSKNDNNKNYYLGITNSI